MAHLSRPALALLAGLALGACGGGGSAPAAPPPPVPTAPPPVPMSDEPVQAGQFVDATAASGINFTVGFTTGFKNREVPFVFSSGAAAGDIDGDDDIDIVIVRGDIGPNLLYRNEGGMRFAEAAEAAGIAFTRSADSNHRHGSPLLADLDGDGDLDLVLPGLEGDPMKVFSNRGDGTFRDVTAGSGLDTMTALHTTSPTAGDYDLDGDLDIVFGHWGTPRSYVEDVGDTEHLWRNDSVGDWIHFTSVSVAAGIAPSVVRSPDPYITQRVFDNTFTPTFARIDADEHPDLLIAGDFNSSQVFINNGDGTFENVTDFEVITDGNGMGSAVGDYDGDGDMDWFVSSILAIGGAVPSHISRTGNRLYRNDNGVFVDATRSAGTAGGGWGWGSCFTDFENDGDLDLYHTNGWPEFDEYGGFSQDRTRAFLSNGRGNFADRAEVLGLADREQGRGVVCADFDNDGDTDILQLHANPANAATLYRNDRTGNNFIGIRLRGRAPNTQGIGARIVIETGDASHVRDISLASNFASHNPAARAIGLGTAERIDRLQVFWPDGAETLLQDITANRYLDIEHPQAGTDADGPPMARVAVLRGDGSGLYTPGAEIDIAAAAAEEHYHFSHWTASGASLADAGAATTTLTLQDRRVEVSAHYVPGVPPDGGSIARRWNEALLQAIRNDYARPVVHARNLFHMAAAGYDIWTVFNEPAAPWLLGRTRAGQHCAFDGFRPGADPQRQTAEAISFAAYRLLRHRFRNSPGARLIRRDIDALMSSLGLDSDNTAMDPGSGDAAALGNHVADCYIRFGLADGSNEADDHANRAYRAANNPLEPELPGNPSITDINRWQPLALREAIDQAGNLLTDIPEFIGPEWGQVAPFALSDADLTIRMRDDFEYRLYHDPGPPPVLGGMDDELFKWAFALVAHWSAHLDPADGTYMDISPAALGNLPELPQRFADYPAFYRTQDGTVPQPGHATNPASGRPYPPQRVPRGDYARVLAEFWADGPDSETPPGHWFVIANTVAEHPQFTRRLAGGPQLGELEWDVKMYFALGGAMHDAAIAAWGTKGWYDYVRPISALRAMADLGQSSDPALPSWHEHGLPLQDGLIELIGDDTDPLAGDRGEHVGKLKLRAWRGPDAVADPTRDTAGVGWIRAENWWPYQRPTFVTPPFAGYVSGHSTYSRAAAEVLTALTGDPFFPGGMSGFDIPAHDFLVFERGPSTAMTLQWATYRDAADQCSLSRIWGGIHPPVDDIPGRLMGIEIGQDAFAEALRHFNDQVD